MIVAPIASKCLVSIRDVMNVNAKTKKRCKNHIPYTPAADMRKYVSGYILTSGRIKRKGRLYGLLLKMMMNLSVVT